MIDNRMGLTTGLEGWTQIGTRASSGFRELRWLYSLCQMLFFAASKGCFCLSLCYEMCFLSFCCKIGSLSLSLCYKKVFTFNFILLHTVFILKRCSLSLSFCYKRGSLYLLSFCHKRCSPTSSRTSLQAALICT